MELTAFQEMSEEKENKKLSELSKKDLQSKKMKTIMNIQMKRFILNKTSANHFKQIMSQLKK